MFFNRNTRKSPLFLDATGHLVCSIKTTWSYHPSGFNTETCPVHKKRERRSKVRFTTFYWWLLWMDGNGARLFPPSSDHLLKHASHAIQNNFYSYGPLIEEKKSFSPILTLGIQTSYKSAFVIIYTWLLKMNNVMQAQETATAKLFSHQLKTVGLIVKIKF